MHHLPETGFLRLPQIIGNSKADPPIPAIIPVKKSCWWEGVRTGRFPQTGQTRPSCYGMARRGHPRTNRVGLGDWYELRPQSNSIGAVHNSRERSGDMG